MWNWRTVKQKATWGSHGGGGAVVKAACLEGRGPRVVASTAAFHARARGSVPGLGGLKETKNVSSPSTCESQYCGEPLRDREVACSTSDRQGSNFKSCVWRTVSSQSSHHPQEVLLAQFSLYVHKGGLKPDSFHFILPAWKVGSSPYKYLLSGIQIQRNRCFFPDIL